MRRAPSIERAAAPPPRPRDVAAVDLAEACEGDQLMRAGDHRDGVDLDGAELFEEAQWITVPPPGESLRRNRQGAGIRGAHLDGHGRLLSQNPSRLPLGHGTRR